jgi:hypothetical protein
VVYHPKQRMTIPQKKIMERPHLEYETAGKIPCMTINDMNVYDQIYFRSCLAMNILHLITSRQR